jgi:uroporphyrinogen-III synthase
LHLLVTRPEPDGERTAATLRGRGHAVTRCPLSRIAPLVPDLGPGPWRAVLISSANGARALQTHPQRRRVIALPAIAVGDRSAAAARQAGFAEVTAAEGNASDLMALATGRYRGAGPPLLYLAGAERAADLVGALAKVAVAVEMRVIYQAVAAEALPAAAAAALQAGTLDGVLHFSRRSAEILLDLAAKAGLAGPALAPVQFCLSERIAEPLAAAGATAIRIADQPTEEALLRLVDTP